VKNGSHKALNEYSLKVEMTRKIKWEMKMQ